MLGLQGDDAVEVLLIFSIHVVVVGYDLLI